MGLVKKKPAIFKHMKRTLAVSLSLAMIGSCFAIQSSKPEVVKAATNSIFEDFETDASVGKPMGGIKSKLTNKAYEGKSALYVSDREQDWCSYSYDVSAFQDNVSISSTQKAVSIEENFNKAKKDNLVGSVFGNPKLTIVKRAGKNRALQVSNRTENYFGYAYNLEAFAGNKISVEAKIAAVGVAKKATNTFNATLKVGDDQYNQVASVTTKGKAYSTLKCVEYDVPAGANGYFLYFEGPKDVSYRIDDIKITVVGDYSDPSSTVSYADVTSYPVLKNLYKNNFKMGVACEAISHWDNQLSEIGNPAKEDLIKRQFNSITFGNELKPDYNMGYNSERATETFLPYVVNPAAKEMLDWAKLNKIPVRGHTLVWHSQCPDAIFCKDYKPVKTDGQILDASCLVSREVMLKRLESYIYDTMEYMYKNGYGDVIYAWDVVNEAVDPGVNEYNLRDSYWYKTIGADFVYYAFKYTKEAVNKYSVAYASQYNVDAKDEKQLAKIQPGLFYNDYNEFQEVKCDAIIKMTTTDFAGHNMLKEGLIDGIGMQGHVSDNTDIASYITALKRYSNAVGEVHITELDVTQTTTGVNAEYYQGKFYYDFFKALIQANKEGANLTSVTIWGLTDDNSWKKETSPLIFNGDLSKKLAFDGIAGAMNGVELPAPAYVAPDFKDLDATFEKEGATVESEGFFPRGDGSLSIQDKVVYDGKYALCDTGRKDSWNGVSFDVSRFIGQTIEVSGWVKTAAPEAKLSADIDGVWPNLAAVDTSDGKWKQLKATYKVPSDMTSLRLYFEASTKTDDIYIDNVSVKLKGLEEGFEETSNIAAARGVGHVPSFAGVTDADSRNEKGHSFLVKRAEADANMKFDVSKYIGYTVNVKAYVKTTDSLIRLGFDGAEPVQLKEVKADGKWTEITATYPISNQLTSAHMYIETDGKADFYVDDISVTIADFVEDCESASAANVFTPRWGGAGTLSIVEDGAAGNHVAVLKDRTENYMGIAFDVSAYLGMEVEISMDVKTNDSEIKVTGDITDLWPNYITAKATSGQYKTIKGVVNLPSDIQTLKVYIETEGKSDLYVDNLRIKRVVD